jgi:hypothetical protein
MIVLLKLKTVKEPKETKRELGATSVRLLLCFSFMHNVLFKEQKKNSGRAASEFLL